MVKFKLKRLTMLLQFHGWCELVGQLAMKGALPRDQFLEHRSCEFSFLSMDIHHIISAQ